MSVELVSVQELLSIPEPQWLIEDHLHEYEIGVIYGPPNVGKSFVALDWALSIAAGLPWLETYKSMQAPVLYLAGEGGPSLQKRVDSWLLKHDLKPEQVPIYFQLRPIALRDEDVILDIIDALASIHTEDAEPGVRPGLVVVDTLSQFFMGGDENGADMALFVSNLRRLSQEENLSVLIVHHTNKGGESERGHTALRGNVDVMFKITGKDLNGQLATIEILNDKQRDNPKADSGKIDVSLFHRSLVLSRGKTTDFPGLAMEIPHDFLVKLLIDGGNIMEISTGIFHHSEWLLENGAARTTFDRNVHKLMKMKLVKGGTRRQFSLTPAGIETYNWYRKIGGKHIIAPSQVLPSPLCNREGEGGEEIVRLRKGKKG